MGKFDEKLGQYNDMWKKGKDQGGDVPEGQYMLQLSGATLKETQSGNLGIVAKYLVVEGEFEGVEVSEFKNLTSGRGPYFISQWIELLGFTAPDDIEDLEDLLVEMTEAAPIASCTVKVKGEFTNIYVNELDEAFESSEPSEDDAEEEEDGGASDDEADEADEADAEDDDTDEVDEDDVEAKEDDDSRTEALKDFMIANGYEAEDLEDADEEEMVDSLKEEKWNASELTEEEVALLEGVGVKVTKPRAKKKATAKKATRKKK